MESRRFDSIKPFNFSYLSKCCAEAQADGVPCPTLGRACETCEKALAAEAARTEESIRPVGSD